jgi:phage antirepressor YoqD-like protein
MLMNKDHFTSLELVDLINQYRQQEGNRSELFHKDFLKVVRDEFEEEVNEGNISPVDYKDKKGEFRPMFILNLSQSRQVLVRESKFVRKAVIAYIDKLEEKVSSLLPQDYPSALRALADKAEETQKLMLENKIKDQQIAELQPKATYYDLVLQCKELLSPTLIAKDYGMSATSFNKKLASLGVQFKQSGIWFLYSKYQDKGYTSTKTNPYSKADGTMGSKPHMYWTQKGRLFLYELLKTKGIIPMIEREDTEVVFNDEMLAYSTTELN